MPPLPTPARLAKVAAAGNGAVPAQNSGAGLIDTLGRHYPNSPTGPKPKPPAPRFRTQAAAEIHAERQALEAARPRERSARAKPAPALRNHEEVLTEIRAIYAQVSAGELDGMEARRRVGVLKSMADIMTSHEIERRVKRITDALERRGIIK